MVRQFRIKPISFNRRVWERTIRAVPTQPVRQMHRIMFQMLRFRNADKTIISGSDGMAKATLTNTIMTASIQPPKYAAQAPIKLPKTVIISAAENPTIREVRVP